MIQNDNLPLITIAVPIYNSEERLENCVDSILKQTYSNLDILLVNDGSTDLSAQICESYKEKDSRVRVIHQKNGGVGASRNTIIENIIGEYVTFIDNDDWLDENHIEGLYETLIKSDSDISVANFCEFIEDEGRFAFASNFDKLYETDYTVQEWFDLEYNSIDSMSQCFTVPWGKLYKSSLLNDLAFPEDKPIEDDYTTYFIYLNAKKITYAHRSTYIHRKSSHEITKNVDLTHLFPLQSIEERLTMLTILGYDTTREIDAYKLRLNIHRKELLKHGQMNEYNRVMQKIKLINRSHTDIKNSNNGRQ